MHFELPPLNPLSKTIAVPKQLGVHNAYPTLSGYGVSFVKKHIIMSEKNTKDMGNAV